MRAESGCAPTSTTPGTLWVRARCPPPSFNPHRALPSSGPSLLSSVTTSELIRLLVRKVQPSVRLSCFELRNHPAVELEFRLGIFAGCGVMRHPSTGDDGHLFPASPDDFRNGPSQAGATLGRRQGRHIDVRV